MRPYRDGLDHTLTASYCNDGLAVNFDDTIYKFKFDQGCVS